ncbi:hypothetical protein [Halomonas alkalisoli]|uniref:hypothetical protein n=1 Tax=Halomonas alkalisoli TaxID=2907158 RepID=UPI001F27F275|nr:hypothetical protein [Halomonas alkalisoli]MCE9682634.1 hypothetical protein [Halomonas alkalisoli]
MKRWLLLAICVLLPVPAPASLEGLTFITEEYPPFNFLDRQGEIDGTATRRLADGHLEGVRRAALEAWERSP